MGKSRYWGLFWIAAGMSMHALVVGKLLESSFFILAFFWGFVAIAAVRGALETAQSMAVLMMALFGMLGIAAMFGGGAPGNLAYTTFALYPALVSWISIFFYIRYLRSRDGGELARRPPVLSQRRAG